jgi:DNA-damage-inducible protein J
MKDKSISIRMDSGLKEQTEIVLEQLGLNMTTAVNMFFQQIVRDQAVPLSLSLKSSVGALEELELAKVERLAGYAGRTASSVMGDMEQIITKAEHGSKVQG